MRLRSFAILAWLFLPLAVLSQEAVKQHVIAVSVDSTDVRIQQMIPSLREEAAYAVEQSAKNIRASIVIGSPLDAAEQARQKSAEYLITIDLSLLSQVGSKGGFGGGPVSSTGVPAINGGPSGIRRSSCQDLINEAFAFSYKVTSLSGEKIKVHGFHTMQEDEYPLGPEYDCLSKFSTHAVRVSASDAVKGLKSKKKL